MDQKLRKPERLKREKQIEQLIRQGQGFLLFPFRVIWMKEQTQSPYPVQVAFSVPKRRIRKAHDRNRVRRRTREAYRLHKNILYEPLLLHQHSIIMMLVYVSDQVLDYDSISKGIGMILKRVGRLANE